jgi:hypothetical protein
MNQQHLQLQQKIAVIWPSTGSLYKSTIFEAATVLFVKDTRHTTIRLPDPESQSTNEAGHGDCMIKWFSVRRPVDCFPVGEEPMPWTYTCRW